MFRGGQPNPYDEIVAKTTDENLTSENWELILNLCDKVVDEGEQGARNVIAAVLKRLAHRNPNVQLYALALVEALSKNCGLEMDREIASRSFTQGLEKLITDRTTHDKVKRKALSLIAMWTSQFENDSTLGIMEECYESLRGKGYKFVEAEEAPPPQVDDEIRRREEEELQRVLEMSVHDKGGRNNWDSYNGSYNGGPSGAGPSSSKHAGGSGAAPEMPAAAAAAAAAAPRYGGPDYSYTKQTTGYAPVRTPSPIQTPVVAAAPSAASYMPTSAATPSPRSQAASSQASLPLTSVSRVRALHSFEGTEQGELTFEKGDIIKVVDRNYKDWWRGQLKGRTGIFPVNYVELLPDPTPDEIAREAEQEAAVFSQAADIDRLLSMLRGLDPARDNLADNEEIQELYRTSMTLRPKIVKLIDKYSQKRAELVSMNESFVKARTMFDRMMEDSLARHSGLYDARPPYQSGQQPRQDYRPPGYGGIYEQSYSGFPQPNPIYPAASPTPAPQQYAVPNTAYPAQQAPYAQPYPAQQAASPYGPPQTPMDPASAYSPYPQSNVGQVQPGPQAQAQAPQQAYAQPQQQQPQQQIQPQMQGPAQTPAQLQGQQNNYQEPPVAAQAQTQPQTQPQPQGQGQGAQDQPRVITQGPPYVFDPNATYPDANAQAWAVYYAQGGTDMTGAVYFISIPGLTDAQAQQQPAAQPQTQSQTQTQAWSQPERQLSQKRVETQHEQVSSPSTEKPPYQAYPAQQHQQPSAVDQAPGYTATRPIPTRNGSVTSLGSMGQGNTVAQYPAAVQYAQPQTAASSPTVSSAPHAGGSFYGAPQGQPSSPGAGAPPAQQAYPPNPYPDHAYAAQGSAPPPGPEPENSPHAHSAYNANAQYAQMHNQFAAMGVGEPRPPASGVAPAAQTA
ncbi:hypothetical protein M0805_005092 [Coniferiporia weirii]|nr:hypothetical protein M0805_005092 [Coniferiporia weirii]